MISGPIATMLLADQGADVIKVESPSGDLVRVLDAHLGQGREVAHRFTLRYTRAVGKWHEMVRRAQDRRTAFSLPVATNTELRR